MPFNLILLPVSLPHILYVALHKCLDFCKGGRQEEAHRPMTPEQAARRREHSRLMSALIGRYRKSVERGERSKVGTNRNTITGVRRREKDSKTRDSADEIEALKELVHENRSMLQALLRRGQNSHC